MDSIGTTTPIVLPALPTPAPATQAAPPTDPSIDTIIPAQPAPSQSDNAQANIDIHAAEAKRLEAVQRAATSIANSYVVSDKTFSIFKDATGQYITRFTSLRDGKVTYIPEPELLKTQDPERSLPVINIKA